MSSVIDIAEVRKCMEAGYKYKGSMTAEEFDALPDDDGYNAGSVLAVGDCSSGYDTYLKIDGEWFRVQDTTPQVEFGKSCDFTEYKFRTNCVNCGSVLHIDKHPIEIGDTCKCMYCGTTNMLFEPIREEKE